MAVKKFNQNNDEIDVLEFLKKWWGFRKLVIIGTIIIGLITTFILIFTDKIYMNNKQSYITAVLKGDLGENNSLIISAYKSQPYISETLKKLSMNINTNEFLKSLIIKPSSDPITENLKNQILSTDQKKLKSLALTNEDLSKIIQNLNDNSEELITIQLYHEPLNISAEQAKNLIVSLSDNVNKNLILRSYRDKSTINFITTDNFEKSYFNDNEKIARLSDIINTAQRNITVLKDRYSSLLKNSDLENLSTLANISQKLLYEISKVMGNSIAINTLNIDIDQTDRDIADLKNSLLYLEKSSSNAITSLAQKNTSNEISASTTQLGTEVFDKILSIGSMLNLNSFRMETVERIQELQLEKSNLKKQKDLLNLPHNINLQEYTLDIVSKRIIFLAEEVNKAYSQILDITEPKSAFKIIKNPELIELNSKSINENIKIILILTILAFFIISFISVLIPAKKS